MTSDKKPESSTGSTFHFDNNKIEYSAFGDHAVVNIQSIDSEKLDQFSIKLKELQIEIAQLSNSLPLEDVSKVKNEIAVVENEMHKSEKITPQVILNSLKEIGGILGKASAAGVMLNQLFDIAKTLFVR